MASISNLPGDVELRVLIGDGFVWTVTLLDTNGNPLTVGTNWTCSIFEGVAAIADITVGQASNVLTLTLTSAESAKLSVAQHKYHWYLHDDDNNKTYVGGAVTTLVVGAHGTRDQGIGDIQVNVGGDVINVTAYGVSSGSGGTATGLIPATPLVADVTNIAGMPGRMFTSAEQNFNMLGPHDIVYTDFYVSHPITVTTIKGQITSASAGSTTRVAIVELDGTLQPKSGHSVLGESTWDSTTTGARDSAVSLSLDPGVYAVSLYCDSTIPAFRAYYMAPLVIAQPAATANQFTARYYANNATDYTAGLPATMPNWDARQSNSAANQYCPVFITWTVD